jgi:hypothetical protein
VIIGQCIQLDTIRQEVAPNRSGSRQAGTATATTGADETAGSAPQKRDTGGIDVCWAWPRSGAAADHPDGRGYNFIGPRQHPVCFSAKFNVRAL